jgi:hypothetical protein
MIYELRTYEFKPGTLPEVEKRFGDNYGGRSQHSQVAGIWHTVIGPLNQLVHLWPYQDMAERMRVRSAAVKDGTWPPRIAEFRLRIQSNVIIPFPGSPEPKPGNVGPFFELCSATYAAGDLPAIMENWKAAQQARPCPPSLCGIWYSDIGELNTIVHLWAYRTLGERCRVRDEVRAAGIWPPLKRGRECMLLGEESRVMVPLAFSPMQ